MDDSSGKNSFSNSDDRDSRSIAQSNELMSAKNVSDSFTKSADALNRTKCLVCSERLVQEADILIQGVGYVFCRSCNHLNGLFEGAVENLNSFVGLEANTKSDEYASSAEKRFSTPLEFLKDNLPRNPTGILDIGCDSGQFVYLAQQHGYPALGVDLSEERVKKGNEQINQLSGCQPLHHVSEDELFEAVRYTAFDVVSALGVIGRLSEPQRFFEAVKGSRASYLYYSVPMFSLSTLLASSISEFSRGHSSLETTHFFTNQSLERFHDVIGGNSIAELRTGEDFSGLYNNILNGMRNTAGSDYAKEQVNHEFGGMIDELQSVLNRNHFCSEIHVLVSCSDSRFK